MGMRQWVRTEVEDFTDGLKGDFRKGSERARAVEWDGAPSDTPNLDRVLPAIVGLSRIAIYGFILSAPGVPFLPWGNGLGITLAILVWGATGALAYISDRTEPIAILPVLAIVMGVAVAVVVVPGLATSMIVAGAAVQAIVHATRRTPAAYGLVVLAAVLGLVLPLFDIDMWRGGELLFSGRASSPDLIRGELLLLGAFIFLMALLHFAQLEKDRQSQKLEAAVRARDEAVTSERARIARELHDVVSHHVTAMTLQSEAAAVTGDSGALRAVAVSGREALVELRRMLGVLRQPGSLGAVVPVETTPQPDLGELDRLVTRTRSGIDINVVRQGDVRPLGAGIELCAYRVVQESLTNTSKHSDAQRADVTLTYGANDLTVEVADDGTTLQRSRVGGAGHGLIGMGERVALLDGELSTGPRMDGPGYRVLARLPLQS